MTDEETFDLAAELEAGLREAIAFQRGERVLETRVVDPLPTGRGKDVRPVVGHSTREFPCALAMQSPIASAR